MGFILAASSIYVPSFIQKRRLSELFSATADAFQCQVPETNGYSLDECLTKYALFTVQNAERVIRQDDEYETKGRLYCNARRIGQNIRQELRIRTLKEVMQACGVIYKVLKIDFHSDFQGQIHIPSCFFSSFYSSDVCRVISSLDEGLVAGLSGGLKLEFSQRLTEGNNCCKAHLLPTRRSK